METSYSILQRDSEYRILLSSVNVNMLSEEVSQLISNRGVDVSELIIDRVSGDSTTEQDVFTILQVGLRMCLQIIQIWLFTIPVMT